MTVEHAITGLIILLFATVFCLAILTIYVDRHRRRIESIEDCLTQTTKAIERLWGYIKDKERDDAKEG